MKRQPGCNGHHVGTAEGQLRIRGVARHQHHGSARARGPGSRAAFHAELQDRVTPYKNYE